MVEIFSDSNMEKIFGICMIIIIFLCILLFAVSKIEILQKYITEDIDNYLTILLFFTVFLIAIPLPLIGFFKRCNGFFDCLMKMFFSSTRQQRQM